MNTESVSGRDIVVIAASEGGIKTLRVILGMLPADLPATLFIVVHIGAHPSLLPETFSNAGPLPVLHGRSGLSFAHGEVYVAPPDHQMTLERYGIRLDRGPKEHFTRPAADPLFRSASAAFGPRVIGIVLTGGDSDGTDGLREIKARGGIAIVQAPDDAKVPEMPENAIAGDHPDYCVPAKEIGPLLAALVRQPARAA
jgi:two-component system chemotaxis response regulator CheB